MCIAIWKAKDMLLSDETLENCWDNNPDGAGFMFAEKRKLNIIKGLMTFNEFKEAYEAHKYKEVVLHFRIATHGGISSENTHPFLIDDTLGIVHNGILNKVPCTIDETRSDTWHFIEKFLKDFHKVDKNFWMKESFKDLIEDYIGNSKLILMDAKGNSDIYNTKLGTWDSQCWFSNSSYKWKKQTVVPPIKKNSEYKGSPWYGTSSRYYGDDFDTDTPYVPLYASLKEGDWATLQYEAKIQDSLMGLTIPAETKVIIIEKFVSYYVVETIGTQIRTQVPMWKLKACSKPVPALEQKKETVTIEIPSFKEGDEIVLCKNYNHFRIGFKSIVKSTTKDYVIIADMNRNKAFAIPKSIVRPSTDLLM